MKDLKEIIDNIKQTHKDFKEPDFALLEQLHSCSDKTGYVETLQDMCNKLYKKDGIDDSILELQVYINKLRCEHDITDPREVINSDGVFEFVQ